MTYVVQPGDSLWKIAQKFGVSLEDLLAANPNIKNPDLICPGMIVRIPGHEPGGCPCERPHGKLKVPHLPEPYPEVQVECQNMEYARLLHNDYAGRVSEISAIMQYLYHHLEMEITPGWKETAGLLEGISVVEMGHMEMLGKAIILLGDTPKYVDGKMKNWTPEYVAYLDWDPCAQLRADIQGEREAIAEYEKQIRIIEDRYLRTLLRRIVKDEEYHVMLLSEQLARLCSC